MPTKPRPGSGRQDGLTQQQDAYCLARAQKDSTHVAYSKAFPNANGNLATLKKEAQLLERKPAVKQRIAELSAKGLEKAIETVGIGRAEILAELHDNAMRAKAAVPVFDREGNETGEYQANISASNQALIAYGKELGMFRDAPPQEDDPLAKLGSEKLRQLKGMLDDLARDDTAAPVRSLGKGSKTRSLQ